MKHRHNPVAIYGALASTLSLLAGSAAHGIEGNPNGLEAGDGVVGQISAPAYDAKTFSGSFCQPHLENSDEHGNAFTGYPHGAVNRAPHQRWLSCPLVRDNTHTDKGTWNWLTAYGLEVTVRNAAPASSKQNLSCTFKSYARNGTRLGSVSGFHPPSPGPSSAQIGTISLDLDLSAPGGFYTLLCYVPPNSSVLSYTLKEYAPTDDNN